MARKRYTDEELKERRKAQWWESRCRCGKASVCPVCGGYTRREAGIHRACEKKR